MASKLALINSLASMVPTVNDEAAKQIQEGQRLQARTAVAQAPAGVSATRGAQQLAPQTVAAAGQAQNQAATQTVSQLSGLGKQAVTVAGTDQQASQQRQQLGQEEALNSAQQAQTNTLSQLQNTSSKAVTKAEIASAKRVAALGIDQDNKLLDVSLKQRRQLDAIGTDVKAKILDSRLQFEKDEAGRKFSNDRQLADYAIATAKSDQELQDRMREMKQASDKKIALLEHVSSQLLTAVQQGAASKEQKLDYEQQKQLLEMQKKIEAQIAKEKADAGNRMAMAQGIGTVGGAVAGGVIGSVVPGAGTVVGASVGATAGGAAGTLIGGAIG